MTKLRKYRVSAEVTISVSTIVKAKNRDEAAELAKETPMMTLCHSCADALEWGQWSTSGELDGEPKNMRVRILEND